VRRLCTLTFLPLAFAVTCARRPAPVSLVLLDIVPVDNLAYTDWAQRALERELAWITGLPVRAGDGAAAAR
jgi:hypothetical protein